MAAEAGLLLFFTFFQFAGISLLAPRAWRERDGRLGTLVVLLALNALLTAISTYDQVAGSTALTRRIFFAVDAPSGALLWTALLVRRGHVRTAWAAAAGAGALLLAALAWPALPFTLLTWWPLIGLPYHMGLAALVWDCASGNSTDRWLALAFAPRALFLAGWSALDGEFSASAVLMVGSGLVILAAVPRLLRAGGGPPPMVVAAMLLVGPLDALANHLLPDRITMASLFMNYLTLALVRPLFMYVAFAPHAVGATGARATFAAGAGTAILVVGTPWFGFPPGVAAITALSVGSLTLAAVDAIAARQRETAPASPLRPCALHKPVLAPEDPRPQWQRLVLALQGSSTHLPGAPGRAEWTQRALAERCGVSVRRVSEFPESLNATAEAKLDQWVPGWRNDRAPGRVPALVETYRGAVEGLGVRTYYRLTECGERLAAALAEGGGRGTRPWQGTSIPALRLRDS